MNVTQFDAEVRDGVVVLPLHLRGEFEGHVCVTLVKKEQVSHGRTIAEIVASPVKVPGFIPFTRDEVHERSV